MAVICSCSTDTISGGGTEDVNTRVIVGTVLNPDGSAASQTQVQLLPADHDPVRDAATTLPVDTTDGDGHYRFTVKAPGHFTAQIVQLGTRTRAQVSGNAQLEDTTVFPSAVLANPGRIKIAVPENTNITSGYLYIPGTPIFTYFKVDSGYVELDSVPAAIEHDIVYATTTDTIATVVRHNVPVVANETATIVHTAWAYSRRLVLNTSATGAAVFGTVTDFPVLIRLTNNVFTFAQAQQDGADIRFTNKDNTFLPFEIERWDVVTGLAEVWVKVDTVRGNDSAQSISMYWGNQSVGTLQNSSEVFDTTAGFQGVWHLGQAENVNAKDATGNHYDGSPSDIAPQSSVGIIGTCNVFNDTASYLRINGTAESRLNFPENGTYTISAWVYADTLDDGYHMIAGKGNDQYFMKFKTAVPSSESMVWEFVEYQDKSGWNITNSLPVLPREKVWTYLAGIRRGTSQYLYVNGELLDSSITLSPAMAPRQTGDDVSIGRFISQPADSVEGTCPFRGKIDEVRISSNAYSKDWITLCFKNQKEQDALVKW